MLYLIYRCTQENTDLVVQDYYAKELAFSDHITRLENSNVPEMKLNFIFNPENKSLSIEYPLSLAEVPLKGEINFFRADNRKLDFSIPVTNAEKQLQVIDCSGLAKGMWKVKVTWSAGDKGLFQEKKLFIP